MNRGKETLCEKELTRADRDYLNSQSVRSLMEGIMRPGAPRLVIKDGMIWGYEGERKVKRGLEEAAYEFIRN